MTDKQIFSLFMTHVLPTMQQQPGLASVRMARNYQQRQQGASTSPHVYFVKLGDHRHGSPARTDTYTPLTGDFTHRETQKYESTFQVSAWIPQTPENVTSLTESDILNVVAAIVQSDATIAVFNAQGVGVLRVTDVRNPYIVNDVEQFEAVPSFDIVLTHDRVLEKIIPAVVSEEFRVGRV